MVFANSGQATAEALGEFMTRTNILVLTVLTVVVIAAAVMMRASREPVGEPLEGAYLPQLLDRSNDVASVIIKNSATTTTIAREGDAWNIEERSNYPASLDKVRELILGLARLQRIEGKTSKPEFYGKLGLDDIGDPGSESTLIQLVDVSGGTLAVLIVGNEKITQGGGSRRRMYVRSPGDPRAWLVEGQLPAIGEPSVWMDTSILGQDAPALQSVSVSMGEETLTVTRESADTEEYELSGRADGEEIDSQYAVNQIARSFSDLIFEDVRVAPNGSNEKPDKSIVAESFDGARITLELNKEDVNYFGRFTADYLPTGEADEALQLKVSEWNERWSGWEYLLPDYLVGNMLVARGELIKQDTGEATTQ